MKWAQYATNRQRERGRGGEHWKLYIGTLFAMALSSVGNAIYYYSHCCYNLSKVAAFHFMDFAFAVQRIANIYGNLTWNTNANTWIYAKCYRIDWNIQIQYTILYARWVRDKEKKYFLPWHWRFTWILLPFVFAYRWLWPKPFCSSYIFGWRHNQNHWIGHLRKKVPFVAFA